MTGPDITAAIRSLSTALPSLSIDSRGIDPRVRDLVDSSIASREGVVELLQVCKEMLSGAVVEPSAAPAGIRRILVTAFGAGDPHDPAYDIYLHAAQLALGVQATSMPTREWKTMFDSDRATTVEVLDAMILMAAGAVSLALSHLQVGPSA